MGHAEPVTAVDSPPAGATRADPAAVATGPWRVRRPGRGDERPVIDAELGRAEVLPQRPV